ncbi:rRNA maturation RNase YbeY [Sulfurimonas sp. SAG-AH-194-L11]|nr:rRNA maturation RNase YbeY [Sulfurimonas sp. SAG-AH-194-L11]MDF1876917.1 rRNA maturation RNase YbeY [Sulfurimonas sp. SAG-AH-194-L11]
MIELENNTTLTVNISLLESISDTLTQKEIELIITSNDEIKRINAEHRKIDEATDVLSFPYEDMPMSPLGSIVISEDFVREKAVELDHSTSDELALLFIHGLLHILGYDHEVDSGEMREKEKSIIELFSLPKSLIVRTQG